MQFFTKPYDDKTGLSYYGYRFYTPSLGRWLTRDPLGEAGGINLYGFVDSVGKPLGTNLYAFTDNNPVNRIDPWGLMDAASDAPPVPWSPTWPSWLNPALARLGGVLLPLLTIPGDSPIPSDLERRCADIYNNDCDVCRAISKKRGCNAARRCYESAMRRYANCLRGQPLPPLDTWNN